MKKTANLDAVPKKDSTAVESITLASVNLHTPRLSLKPLAGSEDCWMSMSAKTVGGCAPCNPFYVKYTDLFSGDNKVPVVADDTSSVPAPARGNLPDDLSSMHVVLHRREKVARSGLNRTNHIAAISNPPDAADLRLLNPTSSNQIKTLPDHGVVNMPQSSLGIPE